MTTVAVEFTANMFGLLPYYMKAYIYDYMHFPTSERWHDIQGMIINEDGDTLLAAIMDTDNTFPVDYDVEIFPNGSHQVVWNIIPTPVLVSQALIKSTIIKRSTLN